VARLRVSVVIDAPPEVVWEDLRHIDRHVEWMVDAVAIRFTSPHVEGTGTTFECDTKVGPFRLTDLMEITRWQAGRQMGVRHVGLVTGTGVFTLKPKRHGRTKVIWAERLVFPWWMAGPIGAQVSTPVLRHLWRRSMTNLAARFA
jgi:hypothetical protein